MINTEIPCILNLPLRKTKTVFGSVLCVNLNSYCISFVSKGILELHPGAINSIPSKSHLEIGKLLDESNGRAVSDDKLLFAFSGY